MNKLTKSIVTISLNISLIITSTSAYAIPNGRIVFSLQTCEQIAPINQGTKNFIKRAYKLRPSYESTAQGLRNLVTASPFCSLTHLGKTSSAHASNHWLVNHFDSRGTATMHYKLNGKNKNSKILHADFLRLLNCGAYADVAYRTINRTLPFVTQKGECLVTSKIRGVVVNHKKTSMPYAHSTGVSTKWK